MKNRLRLSAILIVILSSLPAFSGTGPSDRDECLLSSKNCVNQVDDIQQRIHRLDREIRKGTRVYSPEELVKLQKKLTEAHNLLIDLEKHGK